MNFLKEKYVLAILAAISVVAIIVLLRVVARKWKRHKKELAMSKLHRQNEALAEALGNPMSKGKSLERAGGPLEISWDAKAVNENIQTYSGLMFEITELAAYSRKKYIFRADKPVTIGSNENNQLAIFKDGVAGRHCVIELSKGKPCVRAIQGERVTLCRGKKTATINEYGSFLNNGDKIELGSAVIQFRAFKG